LLVFEDQEHREIKHTRQSSLPRQAPYQRRHQRFIRHGIDHASDDGLLFPAPCDPAIDQVRDSGISEQNEGVGRLLSDDQVANDWSCDETGEGEEVGEGIDVLVGEL
jgi:hypothetical protein